MKGTIKENYLESFAIGRLILAIGNNINTASKISSYRGFGGISPISFQLRKLITFGLIDTLNKNQRFNQKIYFLTPKGKKVFNYYEKVFRMKIRLENLK